MVVSAVCRAQVSAPGSEALGMLKINQARERIKYARRALENDMAEPHDPAMLAQAIQRTLGAMEALVEAVEQLAPDGDRARLSREMGAIKDASS